MAIFDDLPDLISDVLGDLAADEGLGVSATYTHVGTGTYNTANGTVSGGSTSTETLRVIVEDVRGRDLIDGLILAQDKKCIVAGPDMAEAPAPKDQIAVGGETFTVLRVVTVQPGAEAVLYEISFGKR